MMTNQQAKSAYDSLKSEHHIKSQKGSLDKSDGLGAELPNLQAGSLSICSERVSGAKAILDVFCSFNAQQSWVQYTDSVEINPIELADNKFLLEAECVSGDVTMVIKHLGHHQYIVTYMEATNESGAELYKEQELYVRDNLKSVAKTSRYRLWYQEVDHRWLPVCQQFLGFTHGENKL